MYLFSRQARLSGARLRDSMAWATEVTQRVGQTTGLEVGLWTRVFSPATGTLVWANSSTAQISGLRARIASVSISSKTRPLYSMRRRGTSSSPSALRIVSWRPWGSK